MRNRRPKETLVTAIATAVAFAAMTGCSQTASNAPSPASTVSAASAASAPEKAAPVPDSVRNPTNMTEVFQSARFIAANSRKAPLTANFAAFKGTLLDDPVKDAILAASDVSSNEMWPAVSNIAGPTQGISNPYTGATGYVGTPVVALATPVGDFAVYFANNTETGKRFGVAVNLTSKKSAVFEEQGTTYSAGGDFLTVAALWAGRAYLMVAEGEGISFPPLDDKPMVKPMAVGALHAVEKFTSRSGPAVAAAPAPLDQSQRVPERVKLNGATDPTNLAHLFYGQVVAVAKGIPMKVDDTLRVIVTGAMADYVAGSITADSLRAAYKGSSIRRIENGTASWEGRSLPASIITVDVSTVNRGAGTYGGFCIAMAGVMDKEFDYIRAPIYFFCDKKDRDAAEKQLGDWKKEFRFSAS